MFEWISKKDSRERKNWLFLWDSWCLFVLRVALCLSFLSNSFLGCFMLLKLILHLVVITAATEKKDIEFHCWIHPPPWLNSVNLIWVIWRENFISAYSWENTMEHEMSLVAVTYKVTKWICYTIFESGYIHVSLFMCLWLLWVSFWVYFCVSYSIFLSLSLFFCVCFLIFCLSK